MESKSGNTANYLLNLGVGDDETLILRLEGYEKIGQPSVYTVEFVSKDYNIDMDVALGAPAVITLLGSNGDVDRYVHGVIEEISYRGQDRNLSYYQVTIVPALKLLDKKINVRIYQDQTVPEIIKQVLNETKFDIGEPQYSFLHNYYPRKYCVQYNESDLDFITRLMSEEGIYYYYEHDSESFKLIFADNLDAHSKVNSPSDVEYHPNKGMLHDQNVIFDLSYSRSIRTEEVSVTDYDFKKPSLNLKSNKGDGKFGLEEYKYPGQYRMQKAGQRQTRLRHTAKKQQVNQMRGTSNCSQFVAGFQFDLINHPRSSANDQYLLTEIVHFAYQPQVLGEYASDDETNEYHNSFQAIPANTPFVIEPIEKPKVLGVQTAVICGPEGEEIYTDEYARVKVQFHWDREGERNEKSSCWIRVAQSAAGGSFGAVSIPRIGQEVIIEFENGDPDRPIVTGSVYHGTNKPPYSLPDNKTRTVIKTKTHKGQGNNEIRFEDLAENQELYIHAEKDQNNVVKNNESTSVGVNRSESVGANEDVSVGNDKSLNVGNNETQVVGNDKNSSIGNNESHSVAVDLTTSVGSNESRNVGSNQNLTVGSNQSENIGGNQSISISQNHALNVSMMSAETIALAKALSVGMAYQITVGDSMRASAAKSISLTAGKEIVLKTGDASITLKSDGTIDIKGKDINIIGSGEIMQKAKKILQN